MRRILSIKIVLLILNYLIVINEYVIVIIMMKNKFLKLHEFLSKEI